MIALEKNTLKMFSYINYGNNIRIWKTIYITLTVLNVLQTPIVALKCYICGDPDNVLLNINSTPHLNPISCDELNRLRNDTIGISTTTTTSSITGIRGTTKITSQDQTKLLEKFTMNCPEDYQGCITQIQDGKVTRSCDVMLIDDCQTANGVTYCYCSYDLCNIDDETKSNLVSTRTQTSFKSLVIEKGQYISPYFDDEDYAEMSGDKPLDIKEIELENPFDSNLQSSLDLNRIAKEHNERKSTILTVISTTLPTKITTSIANSSRLNVTSTTTTTTTTTTINSNIEETTKSLFSSTTQLLNRFSPRTTVATTVSNFNLTKNNKENSWTFRIKTYDNQENINHQSTTKRTTDLFPTTNIYNRNSNSNPNHSNKNQFYIYLIIIPIIIAIKI